MNSRVRSWRACLAFYLKASAVCPFMLLGSFLYTRPAPLFFLGVCLFSGFTGAGGRKKRGDETSGKFHPYVHAPFGARSTRPPRLAPAVAGVMADTWAAYSFSLVIPSAF